MEGGGGGGFDLEQSHGKSRVRVGRVWRKNQKNLNKNGGGGEEEQLMVEWNVQIQLLSHCKEAYLHSDNSRIVATDSIKNTVYVKAKECSDVISVEEFALLLGQHFSNSTTYPQVTRAIIKIIEKPWERISVYGQPHSHGFKLGSEKHTTEVIVNKGGAFKVTSGIEGLALLKTTKSGFEGFVRDKYTLLAETRERLLATEVSASWRYSVQPACFTRRYMEVKEVLCNSFFGPPTEGIYSPSVQNTLHLMAQAVLNRIPEIEAIHLKMPNLHFLPVNLEGLVQFEHDVYIPTDEPHGTIEATLSRQKNVLLSRI